MVLLTAVPVSGPLSMVTGVMVATGAAPAAVGSGATGPAVGGPASGGAAEGGGSAIAVSSPPPNILSISVQAVRLRPAASAKARNRPLLSPCCAGIPLIMLSVPGVLTCRPKKPDLPAASLVPQRRTPKPNPVRAPKAGGPSRQS